MFKDVSVAELSSFASQYPGDIEGMFSNKDLYFSGETIKTFYYTKKTTPRIFIELYDPVNKRWIFKHSFEISGSKGNYKSCDPRMGCDWSDFFNFIIPKHWPSSMYRIRFLNSKEKTVRYHFVVANKQPKSKALYIFDLQTPCAYNFYGGASYYLGLDNERKVNYKKAIKDKYSCRRPQLMGTTNKDQKIYTWNMTNKNRYEPFEGVPFLSEISKENNLDFYAFDPNSKIDIELLKKYSVVVINGSFEYVTKEQTLALKNYVLAGGRVLLNAREYSYGIVKKVGDGVFKVLNNRHTIKHAANA